jgi:hypothetical protein
MHQAHWQSDHGSLDNIPWNTAEIQDYINFLDSFSLTATTFTLLSLIQNLNTDGMLYIYILRKYSKRMYHITSNIRCTFYIFFPLKIEVY